MLEYKESLQILKKIADHHQSASCEEILIEDSVGRVLSTSILARENNPPFDNSAMDGFAVKTSKIKEQLSLGQNWFSVEKIVGAGDEIEIDDKYNEILEIMTGAPVPNSEYDAVIKVEDVIIEKTTLGEKKIKLKQIPAVGENIRRAGQDFKVEDVLLEKGTIINEQHLLILATQGIDQVPVRTRLKCGIISTGKELVDYKEKKLTSGQIRNSTGIYLQKILNNGFCEAKNFGMIKDEAMTFIATLKTIFDEGIDLVVSTGGVSMGVFDFVKPALEELGAEIHFHKCAIRPGKPILFASLNYKNQQRFIFGVPGNPVSTVVGYNFFIKPFLRALMQLEPTKSLQATLIEDVKKPEGLRCFFKAHLSFDSDKACVESLPGQASFMVSPLASANAWVVLPEEGSLIKQKSSVEVFAI